MIGNQILYFTPWALFGLFVSFWMAEKRFELANITRVTGMENEIHENSKWIVDSLFMSQNEEHSRKFFEEDLPRYFNVKILGEPRVEKEFQDVLKRHDIRSDSRFKEQDATISRNIERYKYYMDNYNPNDRRFYAKWAGKGFGYGIYANVPLKANTFLGVYTGVITDFMENTDYTWSYPVKYQRISDGIDESNDYLIEAESGNISFGIDSRFEGNMLRLVNHNDNPNTRVEYIPHNNLWQPCYITDTFIDKDEQIFVSYGQNYWKNRQKN